MRGNVKRAIVPVRGLIFLRPLIRCSAARTVLPDSYHRPASISSRKVDRSSLAKCPFIKIRVVETRSSFARRPLEVRSRPLGRTSAGPQPMSGTSLWFSLLCWH